MTDPASPSPADRRARRLWRLWLVLVIPVGALLVGAIYLFVTDGCCDPDNSILKRVWSSGVLFLLAWTFGALVVTIVTGRRARRSRDHDRYRQVLVYPLVPVVLWLATVAYTQILILVSATRRSFFGSSTAVLSLAVVVIVAVLVTSWPRASD